MTKKICHKFPSREGWRVAPAGVWFAALVALFVATPSFAEPTELDKKTVASKAYVDTKQDIIETGLVNYYSVVDDETSQLPSLVSYDSTSGLIGNKIGILDYYNVYNDEWSSLTGAEMDNFVPTVRAVANSIQKIFWQYSKHPNAVNTYSTIFDGTINNWPSGDDSKLVDGRTFALGLALKQNILPAKSTGNSAPKGNQVVVLSSAGNPSNVYTTAGKDLALTAKSGAQKVMNYIDGTTASATFATSQGLTEAKVKSALVSLELLKDVYSELNSKITNNALPTGTTGTVVTYNGVNAETGVQEFTETAISGTATYDDNDQLTNGNNIANVSLIETEIATRQKKRTCAGYEPGHENEADYCWLWNFPD